jgi:hypothetical protein
VQALSTLTGCASPVGHCDERPVADGSSQGWVYGAVWLIESPSVPADGDKIEGPAMGRSFTGRPRRPVQGYRVTEATGAATPDVRGSGMELLRESAETLEATAQACDDPEDAIRFSDLAARVRAYLASSRSTTPLGMPHIPSALRRLGDVTASSTRYPSHVRVLHD